MKYCSKCGKELFDEAIVCTNCGCAVGGFSNMNANVFAKQEEDQANVGLCILSALIPLFGIIYWPVQHKKTPKKAMACGITGIVSWVAGTIFWAVFMSVLSELLYFFL